MGEGEDASGFGLNVLTDTMALAKRSHTRQGSARNKLYYLTQVRRTLGIGPKAPLL